MAYPLKSFSDKYNYLVRLIVYNYLLRVERLFLHLLTDSDYITRWSGIIYIPIQQTIYSKL